MLVRIWRRGGIQAPIGDGEVRWRCALVCLLLYTPSLHLKESSVFLRVRNRSNRPEVVARVVAKQTVAGGGFFKTGGSLRRARSSIPLPSRDLHVAMALQRAY